MKKRDSQIGVGTFEISDLAKKYVQNVLDTNRLSYGVYTEQFENEFAEMHERQFGIFCNSGTSALQVALAALKEEFCFDAGDEVIVPAVTFIATPNIVLQNQMKPVFVDIDPDTYNIDADIIEDAITDKTRVIIPVHLFGLSAEMEDIMKVSEEYHLAVLEDSCESMFVKYQGKSVGSMGHISCYSTYVAHLLTTGVGGISLTNDPDLAVLMRSMCNHGRDSIYLSIDDDKGVDQEKMKEIISKRFSFERMGYSYRATEMEAALGLAQLDENPMRLINKRQENALMLIVGLTSYQDELQLPVWPDYSEHAFMMFPVVVREGAWFSREDLVSYLEQHNIETRYMMPLLSQPYYRTLFGNIEKHYPVAQWVNQNGFYIGCHQGLNEEDIGYIIEVFDSFFESQFV